MSFFKTIKKFFIVVFFCFFSFFVLINIPAVQKKIFSEVCNAIYRKTNFIIQYEDVFVKYFHIVCVTNLKVLAKDSHRGLLEVASFRLKIDPFSFFFRRVLCFSDIDVENIDVDFLSFVKKTGETNKQTPKFLSFFSVEVNNLKLKKSSFKINESFFLKDVSGVVKKCFLSDKSFFADVEGGSFFYNDELWKNIAVGFSFFFKKQKLDIEYLSFSSLYGVFDGKINVGDLASVWKKDFRNCDIFVSINKFLFPIEKIKNEKIVQVFSNKNAFISFAGECFFKNNSIFFKNFSAKYLNSFSLFNLDVDNVFDYEKIKYSMSCDKIFLDLKNFIFPVDDSLRNKINACSFVQKTFSFSGDLFNCLVDVDVNTGLGKLKSTIKIQNQPIKTTFFGLKKIQTEGFLSDNVFSVLPGFKNIKTRFLCDFDVVSKDFSLTLNLDKCQYEGEIFQNIGLSCQGNSVGWGGKIFAKDDIFSSNLTIKSLRGDIKIKGSWSMKRFPLFFQKFVGNKLKHVKTDVDFVFSKNKHGFSLSGDLTNLSFFYLNDFFVDEKISVKYCFKDGLSFFDFKSSFLDAETKNVPWDVMVCFSPETWQKEKSFVFNGFFDFPVSVCIKKPFLSFFPVFKKISMSSFSLEGGVKNDGEGMSCVLNLFSLENTLIKNNEIKPFNIDFSFVGKNSGEGEVLIKSDSLVFNKRFFSLRINAFFSREKTIKGKLQYWEKNKEKNNILFTLNKESKFWFLDINSPFLSGRVGVNSQFCVVENFVLKNRSGKIIFSFSGNIDFIKKNFGNIKMFCDNINIVFFSLFLDKTVGGFCSCDVMSGVYNIKITDFFYGTVFYGNVQVKIKKEKDFFSVVGELFDKKNVCSVSGKYFENKMLDFNVVFDDFGLNKINPLVLKLMVFNGGVVRGNFSVKGDFSSPKFLGSGQVIGGNVFLYDTGTLCKDISASVVCYGDNKIRLDNMRAYDNYRSLLKGSGFFQFVSLVQFQIQFSCDFNNFELLNLKKENNDFMYGGGFFSGKINISYCSKKLEIICDLKSNKTNFFFILGGGSSGSFISVFETKRSFWQKKENFWGDKGVFLSGVLDVGEESFFTAQIGKYMKITCNGSGEIKFSTDFKNLFDFNGDYNVGSGVFVLDLYNLFTKTFYLRPGGSCLFRGPIDSIVLNLSAAMELDSFVYKGLTQSVDVVVKIFGPMLNFDFQYSVFSKLGDKIFSSQNINRQSAGDIVGAQWKKFFLILFYKTLEEDKPINSLFLIQINNFFNEFLNEKLGDKNFKLTVDFSSLFDKNVWDRRLKYDFLYKVSDKLFFYKSGFWEGLNSLFENISLRYMFMPGVFGAVTFLPKIVGNETTNGVVSGGFFFDKSFDI